MSAKYPYLDIAISVLNEGSQPVNYSFNSAPTIALPSLSDLARHFVNLSDGYVMWQVGGRRAFTYFQLNAQGTATSLAITIRLDENVLIPGRPIVNLLGTIRRTLTDGNRLTHELLMLALSDSGFPEKPYLSMAETTTPAAATGLCCRTYISSTELANIMAYPRQEDYIPYQGVVVVPATVSMQPESSIPLLTSPIDKALMVVCPEDVTVSATRVELSDHLTVTYNMPGFDPQSVEFEVGTTNRYVRINGPALLVNSARHAGITFRRDIAYSVMSATGNSIDTYTILINGRTATRNDGTFEVSNTDFNDGKVTIAVSSTNFGSYSHEFTPEELSEASPLEIILEPEAREVCLRLDFGGGRIIEDSIVLEKSTPEYNRLRAGSFHGFRAHRLMGSTPETYNIDVRQQAQPANAPVSLNMQSAGHTVHAAEAQRETTATATRKPAAKTAEEPRHHGPVPPPIVKAPSAIWEETTRKRVAPKFENITDSKSTSHDEPAKKASISERLHKQQPQETGTQETQRSKMDIRLIIIGVATIAAALIIYWLVTLFSGSSAPEQETSGQPQGESIEEVTYSETISGDASAAQTQAQPQANTTPAAPVAAANDQEKADIEYLNNNNTWKLSDLKSEKYRALITAMQAGDIQQVASNPYFAVSGTATNKKAEAVVNYLWKAKGSQQEKRNIDKLRELTKADKADLGKLIDDLSRYQPKEGNTEPRPGSR